MCDFLCYEHRAILYCRHPLTWRLLFHGAVEFTQEVIEATLTVQLEVFSGMCFQVNPVLEPFFLRSVVHLCISGARMPLHDAMRSCS